MFRKISPLLLLQMACSLVSAQEPSSDSSTTEVPLPGTLFDNISPTNLPDNCYAWNLLRKDEKWDTKYFSRPANWAHNGKTPDASKNIFSAQSVALAFFKPAANPDGSKNYQNYMYSLVNLDFTPLTLGGLYVENGAVGTTDSLTGSTINDRTFSIVGSEKGGTYYLNILSAKDSENLQNPISGTKIKSTPVNFEIHENFTFGSADIPFTGVNIYSDWNLAIDTGKILSIYGELRGGAGTTITLSNGGQLSLYRANYLLQSDWYLKDNSILKLEATVGSEDSSITSANLMGSGKITVEKAIIEIAGKGATINNNIEILAGGKLTVREKDRNAIPAQERPQIAYYINVTGKISGAGTFSRDSASGLHATNEVWVFTGNNSEFYGNWETNADVDYFKHDKVYDYLPIVFGNGSVFNYGDNFYAIAGHGAIIGLVGQDSRAGMGVGFNYGSDVILHNDLRGTLKIRHMSSHVLDLRGNNTHGYGTYSVAGGTIRFSEAANLGSLFVERQTGGMMQSGGTVALNNGSTIAFAGTGTVSVENALFNTQGNWGIDVENEGATLNWNMSHAGIYDSWSKDSTQQGIGLNNAKRTGDFTKSGKGTLVVTSGSLVTGKENGTANNRTIHVKEGTLAFSGDGTWGDAAKIILNNGVTFDVKNRTDGTLTLGTIPNGSSMTLSSDKTSEVATQSTINGNLTLNAKNTIEFVMLGGSMAEGKNPQFNSFKINGDFNLFGTDSKDNQAIFQFSFLNGLYVSKEGFYLLLTANSDFGDIDFSNIKLAGLQQTNSRQSYKLYASGSAWTDSDGIVHQEGTGDPNGKELYLYASPDVATLTWNKSTGGKWMLKNDIDDDRLSWNAAGQTIKDNDTRFYHNDSVIFGDNAGDVAGSTKNIDIISDVSPAQVTVKGSGHYVFSSSNGSKIIGQGNLVKEGSGTLDIYTSNTYTAGTRIEEGTVNAYGANAFGTGMITLSGNGIDDTEKDTKTNTTLNIWADNALGSADLLIKGGILNIHSTNSAARKTELINGGFIYAYGSNSLGSGTLLVQDGTVYARGTNAIGGNVILDGSKSHLYTQSKNSLGNTTVTVMNGGTIHSALNPGDHGWTMGEGSSIILSDGGIFEINSSTAVNTLSKIKFDGGELRVNNGKISATGLKGDVEIVNGKKAIINTVKTTDQLTLSGQLGTRITAHILKKGEGELVGELSGDFLASMEIEAGRAHLIQGKNESGNYTTYKFTGDLSGTGTMAFSGGSIFVSSNMFEFDGTLFVDLDDENQHLLLQTHHKAGEKLFDVTINRGNLWIDDNSGSNIMHCGNLSSGTGEFAHLSIIGMSKLVDPTTVRGGAIVSVTQDRDDEFKGTFVNGGTKNTIVVDLEKKGGKTLTLTGDSTTLGTMTINEGAIRLGNGGTTGFWTGKIVNNAKLEMDYGNVTKTYSQEISGTGTVQIGTGAEGNVIFTAKNTYTGGTVIDNGNVQLKEKGTLGDGEITMSGKSTLDVTNRNGVENRTIRVSSGSTATIKTASLGNTGVLTSAAKEGDHAAISATGGSLDNVTLDTTDGKATLSGIATGTSITLDAGSVAGPLQTTPVLSNMTLGLGSIATATNGTSNIINSLSLNYGANSISGLAGNKEIVDAKLALGTNGVYNVSGITQIAITIDQAAITPLGNEQKLTIHLFGQNANMENVLAEGDTSGLANILLSDFLREEGWSVSLDSTDKDSATAWWKNGEIVLVKGQNVPEPSSSVLLLASALMMSLRRKRRA